MTTTHLSRRAILVAAALGLSVRAKADPILARYDEQTRDLFFRALDHIGVLPAPLRAQLAAVALDLPVDTEQAHAQIGQLWDGQD